ncbi:MAG: hypothetical protein CVV23_09400 [Ignavibacteriae bacterium HGW-Ignavibacteriae-2]|nr:YihY/virulence factor BrkB family protein [Bacteroidota bacterium]PKL88632.1 MAG: hypothetical protein CVV23_09400 [Ignavibacteriae bacterium HGW-Ignavibacteriae-2]
MSKFKFLRVISSYISVNSFRRVMNFLKYYLGGLYKRTDKHHIFLAGAGIAFSLILSLVPFILLALAILGNIINTATVEIQITKIIETIIPYPEYATFTKSAIMKRIPDVIEYKNLAGYVGALGLLFTSTWLFSSMRTVLNNIFGSSDEKGAIHALFRDFGMVLLVIVFILLSTFILPLINVFFDAAEKIDYLVFFRIDDLTDIILSTVSILLIFAMFYVFYRLIPYADLGSKIPIISALWATVLWELARRLFGYYVYQFLSQNRVYGAFIIIVVILFWLFYSSCLFILGAEIGQLYRERHQNDPPKEI